MKYGSNIKENGALDFVSPGGCPLVSLGEDRDSGVLKFSTPFSSAVVGEMIAVLVLLLIGLPWANAEGATNAVFKSTNILAFHLVAGKVPEISVADVLISGESGAPLMLKLESSPILSDSDFVAWDITDHTFAIKPEAVIRMVGKCDMRVKPFVLYASGEPIYYGKFWTMTSSSSEGGVPVILTDMIVSDCFMGVTNVPDDVWRMIGRGDPAVTQRLLAMTNAATNVSLRIDLEFGHGLDRRGDKRIVVAADRLFGRKQ